MKRCPKCKKLKEGKDFHNSMRSKDGKASYCKKCAVDVQKEWVAKNPDRQKLHLRKYQVGLYGLSLWEYEDYLEMQDNACAICHAIPDNNLSVDHDHLTGKVRGLLCGPCNRALGFNT
jgi:hypothetical protein